MFPFMN